MMASCKDCLHVEVCVAVKAMGEEQRYAEHCKSFKNKADFVEVVRCRKCKHHHWEQEDCHGKPEPFCSRLNMQVFADFHCSYGERSDTYWFGLLMLWRGFQHLLQYLMGYILHILLGVYWHY